MSMSAWFQCTAIALYALLLLPQALIGQLSFLVIENGHICTCRYYRASEKVFIVFVYFLFKIQIMIRCFDDLVKLQNQITIVKSALIRELTCSESKAR